MLTADYIELERADGVALENVQSFLVEVGDDSPTSRRGSGTARRPDAHLGYPNVTILGEATHTTSALSRRRELKHKISVWITDREVSPDSELAQIKLYRYVEAVERILAGDPSLGGKVINSTIISHRYFHNKGKEVGDFVRVALVVLEVLERPSTAAY